MPKNLQNSCLDMGLKVADKYKQNNDINYLDNPFFHYNQPQNKCYMYAEVYPYQAYESARVVLDVQENKEILVACFTKFSSINYIDHSKYPADIINQTKFIQLKNQYLELEK